MGYHLRRLLTPAKQKKLHNVQPAPSSSRTSHSCNSHEAFEGTVPDLHSSGLLRVQRPCVHRIPFLFSGPSRRPPPGSRCPPPSAPGQPPSWPVHRQPPPALPQCRAALPPHPIPRLTLP